jgi:nucleotide-binding universal stress UspA family protein
VVPFRSVLAAVDFSTTSRAALSFAARLASAHGAQLHVLYVQNPALSTVARNAGIDLQRELRDHLEAFVRSARPAAQCRRHLHVVLGSAAVEICRHARRRGVDVVVVGSRGLSESPVGTLGATAAEVLRCATRPVLVLPDVRVSKSEPRLDRGQVSRAARSEAAEIAHLPR